MPFVGPVQENFLAAMAMLYRNKEGTDAVLLCQDVHWEVHAAVLLARSPSFLGVKLKRWSGASKDIVIEDCKPEVLDIVVNYMYGIEIPDLDCLRLCQILDIAERFLMPDLKAYVENLAVKILNRSNVKELCAKADMFSCNQLLEACVQFMVKEGISLDKEEVKKMPDATEAYLGASKVELDKKKGLEKILKKQEREITALRATLRTKSSISTSAKPIPSEREQSVDGRSRGLGGKRSSDERSNNEIETEEEEEEDFSSPPAKVVTPSKRRVVVEYYTSEEEAESSVVDQTYCFFASSGRA